MADTYQDLVGEVDVISSSKNIKTLLKMPYSESPTVSIIVHRLRKTLLLEEFDVHKHLLKKEANCEHPQKESCADSLYKNLIHHTFLASAEVSQCTVAETAENRSNPKESGLEASEELTVQHQAIWKFHDVSMLIDSDLPIFGGGESRPCIRLQLQDASSPSIDVLTGIDYYLDNLMCHVPELSMHYHNEGLVQKYTVLRTTDIPNLENSRFDPEELFNTAQNLINFIQRKAKVEGRTYWLYKSKNSDVIKLHDLQSYCKDICEGENPFVVPIGLLCHRLGQNLIRKNQDRQADARALFQTCTMLLDENKHPQVCAEAHCQLSGLWVPDTSVNDVWHGSGKISDPLPDLHEEDVADSEAASGLDQQREKPINAMAMQELLVRGMRKTRAWKSVQACHITGSTDKKCRIARSHICKGLNCVGLACASTTDKDESPENWKSEAKFQLFRKSATIFSILGKDRFKKKTYWHMLQHLRSAVICKEAMRLLKKKDDQDEELYFYMLHLAAKTRCSMHINWSSCCRELEEFGEEEAAIVQAAHCVTGKSEKNAWIYNWPINEESNLLAANKAFEQALKLPIAEMQPPKFILSMKKDYATCIMHLGFTQLDECKVRVNNKETVDNIKSVWTKCLMNFQKARQLFESCDDINAAGQTYIYLGLAYARAAAWLTTQFSQKEYYFSKMVLWYEKSLSKIDTSETMKDEREAVNHELRIHFQMMGLRFKLITEKVTEQDFHSTMDNFQKSLDYCFTDTSEKHFKKSQLCAAVNHRKMARLYSIKASNCKESPQKNVLIKKMKVHYKTSVDIFKQMNFRRSQMVYTHFWVSDLLRFCTPEKVQQTNMDVLRHLCGLQEVLMAFKNGTCDPEDEEKDHFTDAEAVKDLLATFNKMCHCILVVDKSNKIVKQHYGRSLRLTMVTVYSDLVSELLIVLQDMSEAINTSTPSV